MNIFNRAIASFESRLVQPYMADNFEKTKYGKEIRKFKNIYNGKRCFLIGNGPSLKAEDLDRLKDNNEITFAFNRVYNIFDQTDWRPTFYISQDEKMLLGCKDIVNSINDIGIKFIPIQLKWYYDIFIDNAIYFNLVGRRDDDYKIAEFYDECNKGLFCAETVMFTAVQLAAYMGFNEIYFIGVDHHFRVSQNEKGEIIVDNKVKDYFSDKYNEDKDDLYIPNTDKSTYTYLEIKRHCTDRNINVYNATRGGKLEVFERVDFDKIFKE